jgi:hypothetical protein
MTLISSPGQWPKAGSRGSIRFFSKMACYKTGRQGQQNSGSLALFLRPKIAIMARFLHNFQGKATFNAKSKSGTYESNVEKRPGFPGREILPP